MERQAFGMKYNLPCLMLPDEEQKAIAIWEHCHAKHLKQHNKVMYYNLLISCKLNSYLADINEQAEKMFFRLVKQLAKKEGVTEQPKADNQILRILLLVVCTIVR